MPRKSKNRKFKIYNNIKVIDEWTTSHRNKRFNCQCQLCGKIFEIQGITKLKNKKDCGCRTPTRYERFKKDKIGLRCGKLLVIEHSRTENYNNYFICKCDCGNYTEVASSNIRKGVTESCGRCKGEYNKKSMNNKFQEIPIKFIKSIKNGADTRGLEYSLNNEFLWNLYLKQSRKCALSGRKIFFDTDTYKNTASLDRIDSRKGYIESNVEWVHKDINRMKNLYPKDYFLSVCDDIHKNNKSHIVEINQPSWIDYFLSIALLVSLRSKDGQTKVGAVLVDDHNHIISTGYNSFPSGMPDSILPNMRPNKYDFMVHAEQCMILNCSKSVWDVNEATAYITMKPCFECLKSMINFNIKKIYYIEGETSKETQKNKDKFDLFLHESKIELISVKPDFSFMRSIYHNFGV